MIEVKRTHIEITTNSKLCRYYPCYRIDPFDAGVTLYYTELIPSTGRREWKTVRVQLSDHSQFANNAQLIDFFDHANRLLCAEYKQLISDNPAKSDWNAAENTEAGILNKPAIPALTSDLSNNGNGGGQSFTFISTDPNNQIFEGVDGGAYSSAQVNDPDTVVDPNYVATEENYTTLDKAKVSRTSIVDNYNSLRLAAGDTLTDTIVLRDWVTTIGVNNYKVIGGTFYKSSTGTENGGTIIVANDNTIWRRVENGANIHANWWEIGGYDVNGDLYQNDSKVEGIQISGDRLRSASSYSVPGQNIILNNEEYLINRVVALKASINLEGNGAVIKRHEVKTTLTSDSLIGTNTYQVSDSSLFRIGMLVNAMGSLAYGDQSHSTPSFSYTISAISGNTITLNGNVGNTIVSGSEVSTTYELLRINNYKCVVQDLTIDGNENMFTTYSWNHLQGVVVFSTVVSTDPNNEAITFNRVVFKNIPSEGYIGPAPAMFNFCEFNNIGGACIHGSEGNSTYDSTGIYINNCKFFNVGQATDAENGHGQVGIYTQSIGTSNIVMQGCYGEGGLTGGVFTHLTGESDNIKISSCVFRNFDHVCATISTANIKNLSITGTTFENCGILSGQATINQGDLWANYNLVGNQFINTKVFLLGGSGCNISNNIFEYEITSEFTGFDTKRTFGNLLNGMLGIYADHASVIGNVFRGKNYADDIRTAIKLNTRTVSSMQSVTVSNNIINGFAEAIEYIFGGTNTLRDNVKINDNNIEIDNHGDPTKTEFAIRAGHGAEVCNNKIYNPYERRSISFYGTNVANGGTTNMIAGWVCGNKIEGPRTYNRMIDILYRNVVVEGNYTTGGIGYQSASIKLQNMVGDNYRLDPSANVFTVVPKNP